MPASAFGRKPGRVGGMPLGAGIEHFIALLIRLMRQLARRPVVLVVVGLPAAFVGLIFALETLAQDETALRTTGAGAEVGSFSRCRTFDLFGQVDPAPAVPCVSVLYTPDSGKASDIMQRFADDAGLEHGVDVVGHKTVRGAAEWLFESGAQVDFLVTLDTEPEPDDAAELTITVHHNASSARGYRAARLDAVSELIDDDGRALALKLGLDAAAAHVLLGKDAPSLRWTVGGMPDVRPRTESSSPVLSQFGLMFLTAAWFPLLISAAAAIDGERKGHHLVMMRMMGMWDSAFWLVWFLVFVALALLGALLATAVGYLTHLPFFTHADAGVHVLAFWAYGVGLASFGLLVGASTNSRAASIAVYIVLFLAALATDIAIEVSCGLTARPGEEGRCYAHLYDPSRNPAEAALASLLPSFHYGKLLEDIAAVTLSANGGVDAAGADDGYYELGQLSQPVNTTDTSRPLGQTQPVYYEAPSSAFSVGMLWLFAGVYALLAWYASQVVAGETGATRPLWFVFSPAHWGLTQAPAAVQPGDTLAAVKERSAADGSIEVHKLSKTYKETTALKECTVTIRTSQVFALLGQNGAGKTTLINLLIGRIGPTHGTAFVAGDDIRDAMGAIHRRLGVCAQDDVLHADLTAAEHVHLHARLRRLPRAARAALVRNSLEPVGLLPDAHHLVRTFSGGMKRRLSVALALLGEPALVTLDEPTTGMDPLKRRDVWRLVQDFKLSRTILLTTHSMEEADVLGDTVGVLIGGRLRALGTPLFLKERYGSGYHVSLSVDASRMDEVEAIARRVVPTARAARDASGTLRVTVSRSARGALGRLLRELEVSPLVQQVGVSHSTLEEVFLALAATDHALNAGLDANDERVDPAASGVLTVAFLAPVRLTCSTDGAGGKQHTIEHVVSLETAPYGADDAAAAHAAADESAPLLSRMACACGFSAAASTAASSASVPSGAAAAATQPAAAEADGGGARGAASAADVACGSARATARPASPRGAHPAAEPGPSTGTANGAGGAGGAESAGASGGGAAAGVSGENDLLRFLGERADDAYAPSTQQRVRAVLSKNGSLQRRARRTLCCNCCCTAVTLAILALIQLFTGLLAGDLESRLLCPPNSARAPSLLRLEGALTCDADGFASLLLLSLGGARPQVGAPGARFGDARSAPTLGALLDTWDDEIGYDGSDFGTYDTADLSGAAAVHWDNSSLCLGLPARACHDAAQSTLARVRANATAVANATGLDDEQAADFVRWQLEEARASGLWELALRGWFPAELATQGPALALLNPTVAQLCDEPSPRPERVHVRLAAETGGLALLPAMGGAAGGRRELLDGALELDADIDSASELTARVRERAEAWRDDRAPCTVGECADALTPPLHRETEPELSAEQAVRMFKEKFPDGGVFVAGADAEGFDLELETRVWDTAHGREHAFAAMAIDDYAPASEARCANGTLKHAVAALVFTDPEQAERCDVSVDRDDPSSVRGSEVPSCRDWVGNAALPGLRVTSDAPSAPALLRHLVLESAALNALWRDARARACAPACPASAECGSDGCGGTCGSCADTEECSAARACVAKGGDPAEAEGDGVPYRCVPACGEAEVCLSDGSCAFAAAPRVRSAWLPMPGLLYWNPISPVLLTNGHVLVPGATMLLLPGMVSRTATERDEGLIDAVALNGTPRHVYLGATYLYDALAGAMFLGTFLLLGAALNIRLFVHVGAGLWLLTVAVWAHAQASMALFASALPIKARSLAIGTVLMILATMITSPILHRLLEDWPEPILLLPLLAHARVLGLLMERGGAAVQPDSPLAAALGFLAFVPTLLLGVGLLLHGVGRRGLERGARALARRAGGRTARPEAAAAEAAAAAAALEGGGVAARAASGVDAEREAAHAPDAPSRHMVVARALTKQFDAVSWAPPARAGAPPLPSVRSRVAVRDLSFTAHTLECLGLLGPNGAGKTTTFRMLTGAIAPTHGEAFVGGDATGGRASRVGFVPQFDVVWPELTVSEHLRLSARLVGARPALLRGLVQQVAEMVNLDGDAFNQRASTLSGGMRRRLSLGIALIGNPRVLFCDEPTTGLDPESRRAVWTIVERAKAGRSVVLTTHSMEEADALCSRIAVVSGGTLRTIGTPLHLKNTHGSGYKLTVSLRAAGADGGAKLEALLSRACAAHRLEEAYEGVSTYRVQPRAGLHELFAALDAEAARLGVSHFALAQPSLEDAFINIVHAAEQADARAAVRPAHPLGEGGSDADAVIAGVAHAPRRGPEQLA